VLPTDFILLIFGAATVAYLLGRRHGKADATTITIQPPDVYVQVPDENEEGEEWKKGKRQDDD
jgi:hypothetical protein